MNSGRAVVVGGGVVGASTAYYLAKKGWTVELVDSARVGGACSKGNCGYICPSHVFPLPKPGAIRSTLPLALKRNSPFAIRPRLSWDMFAWFAKFAGNCRADLVHETSIALNDLLQSSKQRYEEMIADEGIDAEWEDRGCLFVYETQEHLHHFTPANDEIKRRFGFGADLLDGKHLTAMEPTLRDGLAGAWFFRCDAHIRSDSFMRGLRDVLVRRGVTIREHCAARGLSGTGGRATALDTAQGEIAADAFVFATGAWTPHLSKAIGVKLPIQPGKGYSITSERPANCPTYPMIFEEHRVAVTPFRTGFRVGSTMEFAGYDESVRPERLRLLRDGAKRYLRDWRDATREETWFGFRPMTPDGRPFVDRSPRWANVMVAAGHNMIGMSTGPGTGRLVAEMLSGETPHFDPGAFRIGRASA